MTLTETSPVWLDVTRLLSRVGRGVSTGIDRVELAYLLHLLREGGDTHLYLCRTTRGILLIGQSGGALLADMVRGAQELEQADVVSKITGRGHSPRHRAEAMLRRHAVDRCRPTNLARLIARVGAPRTYLNVGHANLSEKILPALVAVGTQVVVMVHDLIPLTHPETVVPNLPTKFAARIERVRRHADLVVCNSYATEDALLTYWADAPACPEICVAHLGLTPPPPSDVKKDPKSFVMLGTIEARKNHAMVLDAWDILAARRPEAELPHLHIIGPRGWQVQDLLHRLDRHPLRGKAIFEHGPLSESETQRYVAAASALVFPSVAEGFGYPPLEALALGTLPMVSDLPVLRETLGKHAVYLPVNNAYCWVETIEKRLNGSLVLPDGGPIKLPTWKAHFDGVGDAMGRVGTRQGRLDESGETLRITP